MLMTVTPSNGDGWKDAQLTDIKRDDRKRQWRFAVEICNINWNNDLCSNSPPHI